MQQKGTKFSNDGVMSFFGIIDERFEILLADESIPVGIRVTKSVMSSVRRQKGADVAEGFRELGGAQAAVAIAVVVSEDYAELLSRQLRPRLRHLVFSCHRR